MKKLCCLLLIVCLLPLTASAFDSVEDVVGAAKDALTEIYGYTLKETEDFTFHVVEFKESWHIECKPKVSDEQPYVVYLDKENGGYLGGSTPFHGGDSNPSYYCSEGAMRYVLRKAEEKGWFKTWDDSARKAFMEEINANVRYFRNDIAFADTLPDYSAARAINDFFMNSYGDRATWGRPLTAWRNAELEKYGFTVVDCAPVFQTEKGIHQTVSINPFNQYKYYLTDFVGEAPDEIAEVFGHPQLSGYEVLSGVLVSCPELMNGLTHDCGLVAFGKGEERMLVLLYRPKGEKSYLLYPVGSQALMRGREVIVSFRRAGGNQFYIDYPVSDTEVERFTILPIFTGDTGTNQLMCRFEKYERSDYAADTGIRIGRYDDLFDVMPYTADDGGSISYPMTMCPYMEYLDADALPKSEEAWSKAWRNAPALLPEGFTAAGGVHLRRETTSRSDDLGYFRHGTIARVLDTVNGDPYPWLHVQIGELTGYMSTLYAEENSTNDLFTAPPLRVARVDTACKLKTGASGGSETVMELKKGYRMHVLAELGDWFYVCIPSGEPGWMMDINGAYGYIRKQDVTAAATGLHLDWQK